jgi:hypothetical protein
LAVICSSTAGLGYHKYYGMDALGLLNGVFRVIPICAGLFKVYLAWRTVFKDQCRVVKGDDRVNKTNPILAKHRLDDKGTSFIKPAILD